MPLSCVVWASPKLPEPHFLGCTPAVNGTDLLRAGVLRIKGMKCVKRQQERTGLTGYGVFSANPALTLLTGTAGISLPTSQRGVGTPQRGGAAWGWDPALSPERHRPCGRGGEGPGTRVNSCEVSEPQGECRTWASLVHHLPRSAQGSPGVTEWLCLWPEGRWATAETRQAPATPRGCVRGSLC